MKSETVVRCPVCGAVIPAKLIAHAAAVAIGRAGGLAGKGSPARRRACIFAASERWKKNKK
jgi:hypothetical protein